jgi:hypothetical protein
MMPRGRRIVTRHGRGELGSFRAGEFAHCRRHIRAGLGRSGHISAENARGDGTFGHICLLLDGTFRHIFKFEMALLFALVSRISDARLARSDRLSKSAWRLSQRSEKRPFFAQANGKSGNRVL